MMCNGFTKLSLLLFYLQISPQTWFRRAVWVSISVVSLSSLIIVCFMFFGCSPLHKAFRLKTEGRCVNAGIFYMATAASNIVTDVILFVLPIPMVYSLRMPRIQKFGAMMVFGIGSMYAWLNYQGVLELCLTKTQNDWHVCSAPGPSSRRPQKPRSVMGWLSRRCMDVSLDHQMLLLTHICIS